jgi:hypothetical protein
MISKSTLTLILIGWFFLTGSAVIAQTTTAIPASRLKAADNLLAASGIETQMGAMYENMVTAGSSQIPADKKARFREIMLAFLNKYMSYASIKQDMAQIYAEEFTEAELKQITKFYLTPAGKKMNARVAVLQQKGIGIAQQKLREHLPEFQADIEALTKDPK